MTNSKPSKDPFFLTNTENLFGGASGMPSPAYDPRYFVSLMGCYDLHQVCNPNRNRSAGCTQELSNMYVNNAIYDIGLSATQLATAQAIVPAFQSSTIYNAVAGRGAAALLASQSLFDLTQVLALPDDQWRLEMGNLFSVSLAKLQQSVIDYALGPLVPDLFQYQVFPNHPVAAALCNNQKVRNQVGNTNFEFAPLLVVLFVGLLLIALGNTMECLVQFARKRMRKSSFSKVQWTLDGLLQLQRLAYGEAGVVEWEQESSSHPYADATRFPSIDDSDPSCPRLHFLDHTIIRHARGTTTRGQWHSLPQDQPMTGSNIELMDKSPITEVHSAEPMSGSDDRSL